MSRAPRTLDATYRARAVPPGSVRFWSWQFAHADARAALLGIYALLAEWHALMDPATEYGAACLKLAWWQEEVGRLIAGKPLHPIAVYLAALPRAAAADFAPLTAAIDAAVTEASGVPLERGSDLEPHARALRAYPLALASRLAGAPPDEPGILACTERLSLAEYLSRSIADYRREARFGRIPFAVDELAADGIVNADLSAEIPPPGLERYLGRLRERALREFDSACNALPAAYRGPQRHLLVLAALGRRHLQRGAAALQSSGVQDMLLAWKAARRR